MVGWRGLAPEQRRAAAVAAALALTLLLPWYRTSSPAVVAGQPRTVHDTLTAFEVFSFVEAAVLLVAGAVGYLVWARSQQRAFHLPGGDGLAIAIGGGWALFLLTWRLFDKPDIERSAVGVQWGLFAAMVVAGVLIAAGQRLKAAHRPEPPNPAEDPGWEVPARRRRGDRTRRPSDPTAITEVLRRRPPTWEGEPPEAPGRSGRRGPRTAAVDEDPAEFHTQPLWDDPAGPPAHRTTELAREEHGDDPRDPGDQRLF